jgi:hypothetical protein
MSLLEGSYDMPVFQTVPLPRAMKNRAGSGGGKFVGDDEELGIDGIPSCVSFFPAWQDFRNRSQEQDRDYDCQPFFILDQAGSGRLPSSIASRNFKGTPVNHWVLTAFEKKGSR